MTIAAALATVRATLAQRFDPDTASRDARRLAAFVLAADPVYLVAHGDAAITTAQQAQLQTLASRRAAGEPLAYLVGHQPFYGRDFSVTPAVLIPRSETELIIDLLAAAQPQGLVADIGTGSGCIAITLAADHPDWQLLASDNSSVALAIAQQNATRHGVADRIQFIQSDLLTAIDQPIDILVANLPYVPPATTAELAKKPDTIGLTFEPADALFAADDGLAVYRQLFHQIQQRSVQPSSIICEFGAEQAESLQQQAGQLLPNYSPTIHLDGLGLPRVLYLKKVS